MYFVEIPIKQRMDQWRASLLQFNLVKEVVNVVSFVLDQQASAHANLVV